jgi:hypothetical protein
MKAHGLEEVWTALRSLVDLPRAAKVLELKVLLLEKKYIWKERKENYQQLEKKF